MRNIKEKSIQGLIKKLDLPEGDKFSQDWEYEIASSDLAIKLVNDYVQCHKLTEDEKFTLMHIIFESINDYCLECKGEISDFQDLTTILEKDYEIHKQILNEWACWEAENEDEMFHITPFIRSILKSKGL